MPVKISKKFLLTFQDMNFDEIKNILKKIIKYKKKIILLYGFQSYPSNFEDLRYELFDYFKKNNFKFGYSDHTYFKNYIRINFYLPLLPWPKVQKLLKNMCV